LSGEISYSQLRTFFSEDQFVAYVGIELVSGGEGQAMARLSLREHHLNGLGIVQGGVIFTLADFTFAVAANSHGRIAVSIHCAISYLKAVRKGVLFAEAREVSCGPKLAVYHIRVTDESGELVSTFEGTAYLKKEKWEI